MKEQTQRDSNKSKCFDASLNQPGGGDPNPAIVVDRVPIRKCKRKALPARHLAVLRELIAGMGRRRFVARSFGRLAETIGCSYNTARNACARLEHLGLITKVRGGGGNKQANAWIISYKASEPAIFCAPGKQRKKYGNKKRNQAKLDVSFYTVTPARAPVAKDRNVKPEPEARTSKANLQEDRDASWRRHIAVDWRDPDWTSFRDDAEPHTVGIAEGEVFKRYCHEIRCGADPVLIRDRYREHVAAYQAQGWHPKGAMNFLRERAFKLDWPMPETVKPARSASKPADDEAFPQMVERLAKAAGTWPAIGNESWRDLYQRTQTAQAGASRERRSSRPIEIHDDGGGLLGDFLREALDAPEHAPAEYSPRKSIRFDADGNVIEP